MTAAQRDGPGGGLLQISDPHFGTEQPGAVRALLRLAADRRPALVVLSGDVTQRATRAQFAAARAFADQLPAPFIAIPGNHDIPLYAVWVRFSRPYARWEPAFGPVRDVERRVGPWHVVALNTTRWWRHKHGEVSRRQIADTARRLAAADAGSIRVVVTHQPVAVARHADDQNVLRHADPALQAWHAAGADVVIGGHIHLPTVLPLFAAPRPMWGVQAGTAVSTRVRGGTRNSVTELLAAADGAARRCIVRFWDWPGGDADFEPRADLELPLAPPVGAREAA